MKKLFYLNHEFGNIGEDTDKYDIQIGDIVGLYTYNKVYITIMVRSGKGVFPMGFGSSMHYKDWENMGITKLISYKNVTDTLLTELGMSKFSIKDIDYIELTQEQIEEKLGYKIKIIQ